MNSGRISAGGRNGRRRSGMAAVLGVVLLASACQPTPPAGPPLRSVHGNFLAATLTPDGTDRYTFVDRSPGFTATAPRKNKGSNLRTAVVPLNAPVSVDQQSCITWNGPSAGVIQPGLTLRVRSETAKTQAIMVTNNIYYGYRTGFNVHITVSVANPQFVAVGTIILPDAVGPDPGHQTPLPWRMCARTAGEQVELKVWAIEQQTSEPAWGDPRFSGVVTVPDAWVYAGQPGYYIGHLAPGESSRFDDGAVQSIAGGTGDAFWNRALAWSGDLTTKLYGRPPTSAELVRNATLVTEGRARGVTAMAALLGEGRRASGRIIRTDVFGPTGADGIGDQRLTVPAGTADGYAADAVSAPSANTGLDDAAYVRAVYQRILRRPASSGDVASITRQMRDGRSRRSVALNVYRSLEQRRGQAHRTVDAVLGRPATAREVTDLAARLPAVGYDPIRLRAELFATQAPIFARS